MPEPPPDRSDGPEAPETAVDSDTSSVVADEVLLDGARHHLELALAALFDRHGGRVLSLAASIVGNHALAESVVLDVFMRCWNGDDADDGASARTRTPFHIWLMNETRRRATAALTESQTGATESDDLAGRLRSQWLSVVDPRPLRDRLLARAHGEAPPVLMAPPLSAPLPSSASIPSFRPAAPPPIDPFPEPATPRRLEVHPPTVPPPPRGDIIEPIPSSRIPHRPAPRKIRLVSLLWGAALLFVIAAGLFVGAWSATGPHASPTFELLARLPGGQVVTLTGPGTAGARARLFLIDGGLRAELAAEGLPPSRPGRAYQVWFGEPGQPFRTGGTFTADQRGAASGRIAVPLPMDRVRRISISEEAATGGANPSGAELLFWSP